ncbi:hypothetical protein PENPOL_c030G03586 [Penicillium polonicum]|uniref:Uncharacterized protein n=1 Tax=Penicillium polonicum TaxID=60169 RepID=A0A1V6N5U2_PENPO|nr:hypothetical protein PENPOL_c030G03586 [Penicillium polonicum]
MDYISAVPDRPDFLPLFTLKI